MNTTSLLAGFGPAYPLTNKPRLVETAEARPALGAMVTGYGPSVVGVPA